MWIAFVAQLETPPTLPERLQRLMEGAGAIGVELLVALAVLLVGWALAAVAERVTLWIMRQVRFNDAVRGVMAPAGGPLRLEPAAAVGWAVHWTLLLLAIVLAADVLGFDLSHSVGDRLRDILPRVVSATIVLTVGVIVAMLVGTVVRSLLAGAGVKSSRMRGQIVAAILVGFASLLALEQLGLAAQFIMAIGITVVAALGLAVGLAFGLGCREMARDLIVEFLRAGEEDRPARETTPPRGA